MRENLQRPAGILMALARVGMAAVFFWAGLSKLQSPDAAQMAVYQYRLVPWEMAGLLSTLLPLLECCAAVGLLVPGLVLGGSSLAILLLALFCGALTAAIVRKLDISCGCFGTADAQTPALRRLMEDVLLLGLCCVIWKQEAVKFRRWQSTLADAPSQHR